MMNGLVTPGRLLAKTIAAMAIANFWSINAVGTTAGVTTLATLVTSITGTPAEAGRGRGRGGGWGRGRGRGWARGRGRGWARGRGRGWRGGVWGWGGSVRRRCWWEDGQRWCRW